MYLVNACKIMYSDADFSKSQLSTNTENQSSNLCEDANATNPKRFESSQRYAKEPINYVKEPSESLAVRIPVESCPELLELDASYLDRPKKFGDRPDVIYKTILRSFKKYYLNEFNEITEYRKKKRRVNDQRFIIEMSKSYVNQRILDNPFDDLEWFVAALVHHKSQSSSAGNVRIQSVISTLN